MITTTLVGAWGTTIIENGIQINLKPHEEQIFLIPFQGEALKQLLSEGIKQLSETDRRELAPLINGGIFLPGQDFEPGPQG